jgi:hypothetical protein
MLRLIKTDLATPRKLDPGDRTPSLPVNVGTRHAFPLQRRHLGLEIVTHEIQFVPIILAGILVGMKRGLRRRQGKNQPSVACIHRLESKDVSEEGAIRLRVFAVHDYVRTEDHELFSNTNLKPILPVSGPSLVMSHGYDA